MSLNCGIVGLPNSGKSTLFNALLSRQLAQVANYPFTTTEPHEGVVALPDERLNKLWELVKGDPSTSLRMTEPEKIPATVTFIDIAGLVKDAHKGEGLGNRFLGYIREVDAIVHVVRAFENPDVPHYYQTIDSQRDIEIVNLELELAGISKPTIYVLNVSEPHLEGEKNARFVPPRLGEAGARRAATPSRWNNDNEIVICAKLEMELAQLSAEERKEYLVEVGIKESGLEKLIKEAYKILDLITFYTIKGGKEIRAWSLKSGSNAMDAAAKVHTDFMKNFIRAQVINCDELLVHSSWLKAKQAGKVRTEGRDYLVQDGDVVEFLVST